MIWQNATPQKKGQLAQHKQRKPKPFIPDFMKQQKPKKEAGINKDSVSMTVDDLKSWLAVPRGV